jgi:hypothetical protein
MAINATEAARNYLAYAVVRDKNSLVKLLERNGVQMPNNPSDKEVTIAVLMASSKSQNFKNELSTLLSNQVEKAGQEFKSFVGDSSDFGFTGIDDFSFTGSEDFYSLTAEQKAARKSARVTADNPQGKSGISLFFSNLGKSLASQDTINSGIQIGLSSINNKIQGKNNALQAESTYIIEKQDAIRRDAGTPKSKSDVTTWVFVGVGVLALGAIIYLVAKKK